MPQTHKVPSRRKKVHMRNESKRFIDSRYSNFRTCLVEPKSKVASVKRLKNGNGREKYNPQIHIKKEGERSAHMHSERQVSQT